MKKILSTAAFLLLTTLSFADPYQWLETDSEETRGWVKSQDEESRRFLSAFSNEGLEQELREIAGIEKWHLPESHLGVLYFCKTQKGENKSVVAALYAKEGEEKILLNPNEWQEDASIIGISLSPNGQYLAYGLSFEGSDIQEWRILDLKREKVLPERFSQIQFSKIAWDPSSKSLYYIKNYRQVYAHLLGMSPKEDVLLYEPKEDTMIFEPQVVCNSKYLLVAERSKKSKENGIRLIDLKEKSSFELISPDQFAIEPMDSLEDEILFISNENASMGKLVAINAKKEKRVVIDECDGVLHHAKIVGDKIACCYYVDASAKLKIFDQKGGYLYDVHLPNRGTINIKASEGLLFYSYMDFFTPRQIYCHNIEMHETRALYAPTIAKAQIVTDQVWYTSKDGTKVPLFLTHRKDLSITENTPVILFGYGGFNIPITPFFSSYHLKWVEEGGILAVANIRGGKEYGASWYEAGRLHNKQNVFDDFISAAEWLIENKIGSQKSLGIFGTSNGGLLVGAALTQRPDLFGAALANKGVLDMLRFHLFTVGRFWISDYGNPDLPADYAYLLSYSPYHNIAKNSYPPTLVNTADHDDRVVPLHSFKFYAALKEANESAAPILLRIEKSCGHGGGDSLEQEIAFGRDLITFFMKTLS